MPLLPARLLPRLQPLARLLPDTPLRCENAPSGAFFLAYTFVMRAFLISALLGGFRGRSVRAIVLLGVCLLAFSHVAADFSPRQPQTVALDVGLSFLRFVLVLLAIFWTQELIGKEFDKRTVLVAFSYPAPRSHYLLGRFLGIGVLLALAAALLAVFLWLLVLISDFGYAQTQPVALDGRYWLAVCGLWLDAMVVAAFALCMSALSTVSLLPLAIGGLFAVAAKSIGPVLDYLRAGAEGDTEIVEQFHPLLEALRWALPDLSRLDWRAMPLYQLDIPATTMGLATIMALSYMALLLWVAVRIANRRELL